MISEFNKDLKEFFFSIHQYQNDFEKIMPDIRAP